MRFLASQEKNTKFQNKRYKELDRLVHSPNHTRANIRVKFPDGYLLQGTFGAKEKVKDLYEYVQKNLFYSDGSKNFYLYETPPKKVLGPDSLTKTLYESKLVPSCMLYFGWTDLDETKHSDGPFLNMKELK